MWYEKRKVPFGHRCYNGIITPLTDWIFPAPLGEEIINRAPAAAIMRSLSVTTKIYLPVGMKLRRADNKTRHKTGFFRTPDQLLDLAFCKLHADEQQDQILIPFSQAWCACSGRSVEVTSTGTGVQTNFSRAPLAMIYPHTPCSPRARISAKTASDTQLVDNTHTLRC